MAEDRDERRSRILVDRPFQYRVLSSLTTIPLLTLVLATLGVAFLGARVLEEARSAEGGFGSLLPLCLALVALLVSAGVLVTLQALRYSHRIAGPAYRIQRSIDRVLRGDLCFRIQLRDGDELAELAETFNRLLDHLERHPPSGADEPLVLGGGSGARDRDDVLVAGGQAERS
ncbi:MAG: HAMP domain-containing protein [Planctomycetota bacterium]